MKLIVLSLCLASASLATAQTPSSYVPKVYPQQQESASTAHLDKSGDTYTFSNNLFEIKFVEKNNTLVFGGCDQMNLLPGTELFTVKFGSGNVVRNASEMTLVGIRQEHVSGKTDAVKGSHHFDGEQLIATFRTDYDGKTVTFTWTAELREGSHYLKTNLDIEASDDVKMFAVIPMQYQFDATQADAPVAKGDSRLRGRVLSNGKMFACLDTPTAFNTVGGSMKDTSYSTDDVLSTASDHWTVNSWGDIANNDDVPWRIREFGFNNTNVKRWDLRQVTIDQTGAVNVEFNYSSGSHKLNIVGVQLIDSNGQEAGGDYHIGYTGNNKDQNVYSIDVKTPGTYTVRCFVETKSETITSEGNITTRTIRKSVEEVNTADVVPLEGLWKRDATLLKDEPWSVGSVVGLMADEQERRSFLAYLERERAVPWRPFPIYNSWWEINIGRTNTHSDPAQNMRVEDAVRVVKQWKENMFDKYGVSIKSFLWDDGWDNLQTWLPSCNFPNGFSEPKAITDEMCSHQGAWLGPTGGYDTAGNARKAYWSDKGGAGMHNRAYYNAFTSAVKNLCNNYDFNYFKFDGIGGPATAFAPREGNDGNEQCEGIISLERDIRNTIQEDIFFNTTVGTWASPLWLNISDCVWRQDQDHACQGQNPNTREQWITYRDNLIYEHFVDESPLMTINSMMSHGVILSEYGLQQTRNMPRDFESVKREIRCAFACGSSQVELYCDYSLLNSICKVDGDPSTAGALWEELANCIKWQREQADVLPDIHWVGADPYTTKENVYGWAAWNGVKAAYSLRNGHKDSQEYTINLRHDLQIPSNVPSHTIHLTRAFADQIGLEGLGDGASGIDVNIDDNIKVTLPGSSVFVFNGIDSTGELVPVSSLTFDKESIDIPLGRAMAPTYNVAPLNASNKTLDWSSADPTIAKVTDGAITALKVGTTTVTATARDKSGQTMTITVNVTENKQFELDALIEKVQADYNANDVGVYSPGIIQQPTQFTSEYTETKEGDIQKLLDGDGSTFWHSKWDGVSNLQPHVHYLQVNLPEPLVGTIQMDMMRRINGNALCANDNPVLMSVEVSTDGNSWTRLDGQMELPLGSVAEPHVYGTFEVAEPVQYFRFFSDQNNGTNQRGYWHCGDFQLRKLEQEALNALHPNEAAALVTALEAARGASEVTQETIQSLQTAYDTYLKAMGVPAGALNGRTLPIPSGVYEIQNAPEREDRGYLVDYSQRNDGPSLAECHLNGHVDKHPSERNSSSTSSYWYVHEKDGKYYIASLSSLQEGAEPRFLKPGASVSARTTYSAEPVALDINEHASYTYEYEGNTYKYMLIADAENGNYCMSAACGTNSNNGSVLTNNNKNDGGSPWQFVSTTLKLSDNQEAIKARVIELIEGKPATPVEDLIPSLLGYKVLAPISEPAELKSGKYFVSVYSKQKEGLLYGNESKNVSPETADIDETLGDAYVWTVTVATDGTFTLTNSQGKTLSVQGAHGLGKHNVMYTDENNGYEAANFSFNENLVEINGVNHWMIHQQNQMAAATNTSDDEKLAYLHCNCDTPGLTGSNLRLSYWEGSNTALTASCDKIAFYPAKAVYDKEATIGNIVLIIDLANEGEATIEQVEAVRDIILEK